MGLVALFFATLFVFQQTVQSYAVLADFSDRSVSISLATAVQGVDNPISATVTSTGLSDSGDFYLKLEAEDGTLKVGNLSGASAQDTDADGVVDSDDYTDSKNVTLLGTIAELNAALATATFKPTSLGASRIFASLTPQLSISELDLLTETVYVQSEITGHLYSLGTTQSNSAHATTAAGMSPLGSSGYLTNITSRAENESLKTLIPKTNTGSPRLFGDTLMIGVNDIAVEQTWRWGAGPEAGIISAITGDSRFYAWSASEPNSTGDCGYTNWINSGEWDDQGCDRPAIYEFGGQTGEPGAAIATVTSFTADELTDKAIDIAADNQSPYLVGELLPATGSWTFETWLKPDVLKAIGGHTQWYEIFDQAIGTGATNTNRLGLDLQHDGLLQFIYNGVQVDMDSDLDGASRIPVDSWTHLAVSFDYSGAQVDFKYFLNGSLAYQANLAKRTIDSGSSVRFQLGALRAGATGSTSYDDRYFDGQMDQVKIWTVPLTEPQVKASMLTFSTNGSTPTSASLRAHYSFNQAAANSIPNEAGASWALTVPSATRPTWTNVVQTTTLSPSDDALITIPRTVLTAFGGWTVPSGLTTGQTLVVGGGGGGGENVGSGGSGAESVAAADTTFVPNSTIPVTIGEGGRPGYFFGATTAASTLRNGGDGGSTTLGLTTPITADPGLGGRTRWITNDICGTSDSSTAPTTAGPGGAGGAGSNASGAAASAGADGALSTISGSPVYYGAGGGGGGWGAVGRSGGNTGGGAGGSLNGAIDFGSPGQANTGAGGGGGGANCSSGGFGGTGVVLIRYSTKSQPTMSSIDGISTLVGQTATAFTAPTVTFDGSSVAGTVAYAVSDTDVATMNSGTLVVTGVATGVTTLTATFTPTNTATFKTATTTTQIVVSDATSCTQVTSVITTTNSAIGSECVMKVTAGTGTWTVPAGITSVRLLIVGGGGGGGGYAYAGGGGAGGFYELASHPVTPATQADVVVGAGGLGGLATPVADTRGATGQNSEFDALVALGGGGGGGYGYGTASDRDGVNPGYGLPGGSGGGNGEVYPNVPSSPDPNTDFAGGSSSFSDNDAGKFGNAGGNLQRPDSQGGSGGGGAGAAGGDAGSQQGQAGDGGAGKANDITGSSTVYAGGGGGGVALADADNDDNIFGAGDGGSNIGGHGGSSGVNPTAGAVNTGSGGGGNGAYSTDVASAGAAGGSGVVIVRYTRAEVTLTQADINRNVNAGVLQLSPPTDVAGTTTYSILDTSIATVTGSVLSPLAAGTTTMAVTFTPDDQAAYVPSVIFATITVTSTATVPDAPTNVSAAKTATDGQAKISWTAPGNNGGSAIQAYTITAAPGGATCSTTGDANPLECLISGLTVGVSYTFSVTAANTTGASQPAYSNSLVLVAPLPIGAQCVAGSAAQNGISIEPAHGTVFYVDTGQGQEIDAGYVGYRVTSATSRSDLWVQLDSFSGGALTLANPSDSAIPLGSMTAGTVDTAYFMLKATGGTTVDQTHTVRVYTQKPTVGNPQPIYECSYTFAEVAETIKAAANKVNSITTSTVTSIGSTMTITVEGDSGTIGQGNAVDGRMFALIPAARSSWPTNALRLETVQLALFSNSARTSSLSTHTDYLRVNASTGLNGDTNRQYYRAVYTFRVIGSAATSAPIIPIAMISSGTQVKHTDVGSLPTGDGSSVDVTSPPVDLKATKSVSTTSVVSTDGITTLSYSVTMQNNGTNDLTVDEVVDTPDSELSFVKTSAAFDMVSIADADIRSDGKLSFSGPFTVSAGQSRAITYRMSTPTCAPGGTFEFVNTATAQIGAVIIGSSSAKQSVVTAGGKCGEPAVQVEIKEEPTPPETVTGAASSVGTTSAILTGTVDPNGEAGLAIRFKLSTSSQLSGASTESVSNTTTASASSYLVAKSVTGLSPNTTYYFQIEVQQKDGTWVLGGIRSFTTDVAPATEPVVATLPASNLNTTVATLNGTIDADALAGGVKAKFEYTLAGSGNTTCNPDNFTGSVTSSSIFQDETADPVVDLVLTGTTPVAFNLPLTGLTGGTDYCYRVVGLYGTDHATAKNGSWVSFETSAKTDQVISWNAITDPDGSPAVLQPGSGSTVEVDADVTSALASTNVVYASVDQSICTVDPSTGVVTPVANSGNCVITATKAGDVSYYDAAQITISIPIATPTVSTTTLPNGTYRQNGGYSSTLQGAGGDGTYTWALCGDPTGSLPTGLVLNAATGLISGTPTAAGTYTFKVCSTSNGVQAAPRSLTIAIEKAPLTVVANNSTVTFGDARPTVTASYEGFRDVADTTIDTAPVCTTAYQVGDAVGQAPTTSCSGGFDDNYVVTAYNTGSVTINKFALTVTALDATKQNVVTGSNTEVLADPGLFYKVGPALPAGQTFVDAFPNGISVSRALDGTSLGTVATGSLPAGEIATSTHAITTSGAPGDNYSVTRVDGTFLVQTPKEVPSVSVTNKQITFGADLTGQLDAQMKDRSAADVGGACVYALSDGTSITQATQPDAGLYTIVVTCTATDGDAFITPVTRSFQIDVAKKAVVVTAGDTQKWQGNLDPDFTVTATGFVGADSISILGSITTSRASGEVPGSYAINPAGGSHPNYSVSYVDGTLYIAKVTISVTETDGVLSSRTVALSCEGLKPGASTTLKISAPETVISTITAEPDGTCSFTNSTIPDSVDPGNKTLQVDGLYPTDAPLLTSRSVTLVATLAEVNGGGGGVGGGGGGAPAPAPTPTPAPTPPVVLPDPPTTPVVTPTPRPTPRPSVTTAPRPTQSVTPAPSATPVPTRTATPTPTETQVALPPRNPDRTIGEGLEGWFTTPADPEEAAAGQSAGGSGREVIYDTGNEVEFTETGALDLSSVKSVTRSELSSEKISGFAPNSGLYIEVLGSRTGARFVATTANLIDSLTLIEAIRNSIPTQAADFFQLSVARVGAEPAKPEQWTEKQQLVAYDYFQASGLDLPVSLADLDFDQFTSWIQVEGAASGYAPGSTVFLTLTSTPLVIAQGQVDRFGNIELFGSIPVQFLEPGEHRVRLVGIRSLGGVSVDENGEIVISSETMDEIERFDLGTQATVRMGGKTPGGDYLNALRVVPLTPIAPWWTLFFILAGFIIAITARRRHWTNTKGKLWLGAALNLGAAIPAVVLGWLSTVTIVAWVGLALGLIGMLVTLTIQQSEKAEAKRG